MIDKKKRAPFICSSFKHNTSHVIRKTLMLYANSKGADQPAHPCSLNSIFIVRCLDSVIHTLLKSKLASVTEQAGLSLTWSQTPKGQVFS